MAPLPTIYVRQSVAPGVDSVDGPSLPGEVALNRPSSLGPREKLPGLNEDTIPPPKFARSDNTWDSCLSGDDIPKINRHARASAPNTIYSRGGIDFSDGFVFDDGFVHDVDGYEKTHSIGPKPRPPSGDYYDPIDPGRPFDDGPIGDPFDDGPIGDTFDNGPIGRPEPMMHDPAIDLTPGKVPLGEVGPPGPSFMQCYGYVIYTLVGVVVIGLVGFFGVKAWKSKKGAGAEPEPEPEPEPESEE